jgi:hypothetical protein
MIPSRPKSSFEQPEVRSALPGESSGVRDIVLCEMWVLCFGTEIIDLDGERC